MTPPSFEIGRGVRIETVNIHQLGDVDVAGCPTLESIKIQCMFPATDYAFARGAADPYEYVRSLEGWCRAGKVLRFVIPDTAVNLPCRLERFAYGERDGTGDVYATLTLREHKALGSGDSGGGVRTRVKGEREARDQDLTCRVREGDSLASICRRYYDTPALTPALASYNGVKNPHLLTVGQLLRIPEQERLGG